MRSLLPSHRTSREGPGCPVPGIAAYLCCPGPALQRAWRSWHARCLPAGPGVRAPAGTVSGHRKLLKATTHPSAVSPPGSPWQGGWWGTFSEMRPQDGCSRALGREAWLPSCPRLGQRCDLKSQWKVLRLRMTQRESAFPQRGDPTRPPVPHHLLPRNLAPQPPSILASSLIFSLRSPTPTSPEHTGSFSLSRPPALLSPSRQQQPHAPRLPGSSSPFHAARGIFLEQRSHRIMPLPAALL